MRPGPLILIVDDDPEMRELLAEVLEDEGYRVAAAADGEAALAAVRAQPPDAVITDLQMPRVDGEGVLAGVRRLDPQIPVLVLTAFGQVEVAVRLIQAGAAHYLTKPVRQDELLLYLERALSGRRLLEENRRLQRLANARGGLSDMVGASPSMQRLYAQIERVARARAPVMIRGESGTGKELVARALHELGPRREGAFVPVNCASLPEALLESELFGHARGAFTGASAARRGLFAEADGGTIFLDEIGDMPGEIQAKLLRVLQEGTIRPVGADAPRRVDVRVIAATHQPLEERVAAGLFRTDLFYRLDVVPLWVPPLRDRIEDIPALVECFIRRACQENPESTARAFSPRLIAALARCTWAGNVRELENAVRRIVILCPNALADIEEMELLGGAGGAAPEPGPPREGPPPLWGEETIRPLKAIEDDYIGWVVERCGGNKTRAAELLGINVSTIHRRARRTDQGSSSAS